MACSKQPIRTASVRFIPQRNKRSGCGPACIAMISGDRLSRSKTTAYANAVKLIFGSERATDLYTRWHHLRRALDDLGIAYADRIHRHRSWEGIKTLSIVKCGQTADDGWHWVVYDGRDGLMYDPAREGPTRPTARMRQPRSHLPIFG